ncbi:RxLR effector family protein [Phytophthora palmivora]|uniref:RxLR effector protein n=1 Tax=Phytophthora palmivora TaxID=4796 RepID=A0A2P4X9I1_9STRA|nr:RxLR effector family protein [Phytophthora palmivora]
MVGLAILISTVLVDADRTMTDFLVTPSNGPEIHSSTVNRISATRLLRTRSVPNEEDTEERVKPSISAFEKFMTMFTSSKVTPEKLTSWLEKGESLETVFVRLRLHQDDTWFLFYNPQFTAWVQYADDLSAKNPTKGIPAISTLTVRYCDDTLYKMIERAKRVSSTETLATKLQTEQMQHWVTTRKDPDDIFRLFNLDKAGEIFSATLSSLLGSNTSTTLTQNILKNQRRCFRH